MKLPRDENGFPIQTPYMPATGQTSSITTLAGASAATSGALTGIYRITTNIDVYLCAGNTAVNADEPLFAGDSMIRQFNATKLAAYCATAGGIVTATKLP